MTPPSAPSSVPALRRRARPWIPVLVSTTSTTLLLFLIIAKGHPWHVLIGWAVAMALLLVGIEVGVRWAERRRAISSRTPTLEGQSGRP